MRLVRRCNYYGTLAGLLVFLLSYIGREKRQSTTIHYYLYQVYEPVKTADVLIKFMVSCDSWAMNGTKERENERVIYWPTHSTELRKCVLPRFKSVWWNLSIQIVFFFFLNNQPIIIVITRLKSNIQKQSYQQGISFTTKGLLYFTFSPWKYVKANKG